MEEKDAQYLILRSIERIEMAIEDAWRLNRYGFDILQIYPLPKFEELDYEN